MFAGRMKSRLTIRKPTVVTNAFGEATTTWADTVTVHAERVKARGYRSEEVGEHFPDYAVEWNVRDCHEVDENWRVKEVGGHLYTVVAVLPNVDRGFNTLVCQRLNE